MRKEPFFVDDVVHVFNRGNRKQEIVRDDRDRQHFMRVLYYFNDEYAPINIFRELSDTYGADAHLRLERPPTWPERKPLIDILGFTLMDNHYHLVLRETREGGIAKFMQKFGTGITNRFNARHKEVGRLFQGSYKARRVDDDNYLTYLNVYIHVKNVCELYSGGIDAAIADFDSAFSFALSYPYSSLGGYAGKNTETRKIISQDMLKSQFQDVSEFKEFARECLRYVHFDERMNRVDVDNSPADT